MTTGGEGAAPLSSPPRPFGPCIRNGGEEVNALRYLSKNFEKILTAIILFSMSSFAFINVISRYVVNLSLNFTEELNLYLFVWLAFLGSAWACRDGAHMSVSMVYDMFPKPVRAVLYALIQAVTAAFFITLGYCGYVEILDEIALNAMTETLVIPVWWFTSSIPIGSALIVLRTLQRTFEDFAHGTY